MHYFSKLSLYFIKQSSLFSGCKRNRFDHRIIVIKVAVLDKSYRTFVIEVWFKLLSVLHCQPAASTLLVSLAITLPCLFRQLAKASGGEGDLRHRHHTYHRSETTRRKLYNRYQQSTDSRSDHSNAQNEVLSCIRKATFMNRLSASKKAPYIAM